MDYLPAAYSFGGELKSLQTLDLNIRVVKGMPLNRS